MRPLRPHSHALPALFALLALAFGPGNALADHHEKATGAASEDPVFTALDAFVEEKKIDKGSSNWNWRTSFSNLG